MPLSSLVVFNDWVYLAMTEVLAQQVALFNAATRNAIRLTAANASGDYSESAYFAKIAGLVRRRNAYGSGVVAAVNMAQLLDTHVKVAAGTAPVNMDPGMFEWINMNPETAGALLGQQLAKDTLADMLNTSVTAVAVAIGAQATAVNDITAATAPADLPSPLALNATQGKFGDYMSNIAAWVLHSKSMIDIWGNALTNGQQLFQYGNVAVVADAFGRPYVISDIPGLVVAGTPNSYRTLGLVPEAVQIGQNDDFTEVWEDKTGDENIQRVYQAEWSWNLGLKGYSWDKTTGGKSPTTAALTTAANWDKIATSIKDTAGVMLLSH